MKKSIITAFALGALSMLSFNVFASPGEDTQAKAPIVSDIEINNEDRNLYDYRNVDEYIDDRNDCYDDYSENNRTQRRRGRGC